MNTNFAGGAEKRISYPQIASRASEKVDDPMTRRAMLLINRHGVKTEIDEQGRIFIPKELKDGTSLKGKIDIEGGEDHLVLSAR